jgi:hypothetical protein
LKKVSSAPARQNSGGAPGCGEACPELASGPVCLDLPTHILAQKLSFLPFFFIKQKEQNV